MEMTLRWSQDHVYIFLSQPTALLHLWSQHTEGGLPTANGHFSPRSLYTACQALPTPPALFPSSRPPWGSCPKSSFIPRPQYFLNISNLSIHPNILLVTKN